MASQLSGIYAAIQDMDVAIGGNTVKTRDTSEHDGSIRTFPVRLILPTETGDAGRELRTITFGRSTSMSFELTDLMLLAPVTQGSGIAYHMPKLVTYIDSYLDAVQTLFETDRHLGLGNNVTVEKITRTEPGIYQYPAGSGDFYFGCEAVWTVRQNL